VNAMGVSCAPGEIGCAEGLFKKKLGFFRPLFEIFIFGHLFLSILKKLKKGCQKNPEKMTCDHNGLFFIFSPNNL
jgi:hypothetical protein